MLMLVATKRLSRARAHVPHELGTPDSTHHPRHLQDPTVETGPTPESTALYWFASCMSNICHWSSCSHSTAVW